MSDDKMKALEQRVAKLEKQIGAREKDLTSVTKALVMVLSIVTASDPKRKQIAERLRTVGDQPAMDTEIARNLLNAIADRIETSGKL